MFDHAQARVRLGVRHVEVAQAIAVDVTDRPDTGSTGKQQLSRHGLIEHSIATPTAQFEAKWVISAKCQYVQAAIAIEVAEIEPLMDLRPELDEHEAGRRRNLGLQQCQSAVVLTVLEEAQKHVFIAIPI